jgi:DNA-binding NtrC family response regulator
MKNCEINVLVVDDEGTLRKSIVRNLQMEDFNVLSASNAKDALEIVKTEKVHFVLSDIRMPEMDGVELVEKIRSINPSIPIIVLMTGFSQYSKEDVTARGAQDMISKPFDMDYIIQLIRSSVSIEG